MSTEKEQLQSEIAKLTEKKKEMQEKIKEIERLEKLSLKERADISSRIQNKDMLDVVFEYYDNIYHTGNFRECSGKVALRHNKFLPNGFEKIRELAKTITYFPSFSLRSDKYVEQAVVKRRLDKMDVTELELVAECADEIISVLYKYKKKCREHQNLDLSDFVIEGGGIECN